MRAVVAAAVDKGGEGRRGEAGGGGGRDAECVFCVLPGSLRTI
jgi:hypothetical protein